MNEDMRVVEEISFRIDARAISVELVRRISNLAKQLGCVLLTADYEILSADESIVLAAINHSTAKRFADDPVSTLKGLDHKKIQERVDYMGRDLKKCTDC
jgi:hypothetical protein